MREETKNILNSVGLLIFSTFAYFGVKQIPVNGTQKTEADLFPKIILGIIVFLTLILLINNIIKLRIQKKETQKFSFKKIIKENKKIIWTFVIFGSYVYLLDKLGYFVSSIPFLLILYFVLTTTKRRIWTGLFGAIAITFIMFLIFEKGLSVYLPKGLFL